MTGNAWNDPAETNEQYGLIKILAIWAAAAFPMAILSWIAFPALAPDFGVDPLGAAMTRIGLLTAGLIWQFVLVLSLVHREEGNLRWSTLRRRLWLRGPSDPRTGERRGRLWLWVIPFLIGVAVVDMALAGPIRDLWVSIFPFLPRLPALMPVMPSGSPSCKPNWREPGGS